MWLLSDPLQAASWRRAAPPLQVEAVKTWKGPPALHKSYDVLFYSDISFPLESWDLGVVTLLGWRGGEWRGKPGAETRVAALEKTLVMMTLTLS